MTKWRNWTGDEGCTPASVETPASVDEVVAAVRRSAEASRSVRVVGAGHSFSDLVSTDGTLMSLDRLTGLLDVDVDAGLVRVAAGTRLRELNRLLDQHGLALANLGDIDTQSVAGAVSTGTHGTGRLLGNLATQVVSLELVSADGRVQELGPEDADLLAAARIGLGALGVVTAYTLRVVPAFRLRGVDKAAPLGGVLEGLDELVDGNDHFEFFWFPHTHVALTRTNNRTDEPAAPPHRISEFVKGTVVENGALDLVSRLGRRYPRLIPQLNRGVARAFPSSTRVDTSHRVFASPRSVRFTESEWAVPREACRPMLADLRAALERSDHAVNFPIEVRFVAGDTDSLLSPAYGRETAYIAVHAYRGMAWQGLFATVQQIASAYGGRPHWGKRHGLDASQLSGLYPEWERFLAARSKLDPDGVFANAHTRRLFEAR